MDPSGNGFDSCSVVFFLEALQGYVSLADADPEIFSPYLDVLLEVRING